MRGFQAILAFDKPYGDPNGKRESAELLEKVRDAGLSIFEPDPVAALEQVGRNGLPGGEAS